MTNEKGIIIVIEGPSGVGKDTIVKQLVEKYPNTFEKTPSLTTREMRKDESQGKPYYFVDEKSFIESLEKGEIFEYTLRHGQYRGMSKKYFDAVINRGLFPVKDCDKIGLDALRKVYPGKIFSIFLTCPKEQIEKRLIGRGTTGEDLRIRLENYDEYVKQAVYYDTTIENIDLEVATKQVYDEIMKFYNSL